MSEKDEVLKQISDIKNHLVDKEIFFPYNYNACHVWAIIAIVLVIGMIPAYEYAIAFGFIFTIILVIIGFVSEGLMTKKINKSYDIDDCTKRQKFIVTNFIILSLFAITLSTILASYSLFSLIFLVWIGSISMGYFAISFAKNIPIFYKIAIFNTLLSIALLSIGFHWDLFMNSTYVLINQGLAIFCLAVLPTFVALKQKKVIKCLTH